MATLHMLSIMPARAPLVEEIFFSAVHVLVGHKPKSKQKKNWISEY